MFKVSEILFENEGKRINYIYDYDVSIAKFFNKKESFFVDYNINTEQIPFSIAIIPLLANIAPIAWFAGFSIQVDQIDETFYNALIAIKNEFQIAHPTFDLSKSEIKYNTLVKNTYNSTQSAMLFSGGVDAYATYFRHYEEKPDLITIHGADVELDDTAQWNQVVALNEEEQLLKLNTKFYITTNLRTFYTHHVDLLLPNLNWWGKVQHGLALNGLVAPIAYIRKYKVTYIASSYTDNIIINWGSTPQIDNSIKWGSTFVSHDAYEMKRQDKVDFIIEYTKKLKKTVKLRVCYALIAKDINCSNCEKCFRTIMGIIASNSDPNQYGFKTNEQVYDKIIDKFKDGFPSEGVQYFWWEILQKLEKNQPFFVFNNFEFENSKQVQLRNLINKNITKGLKKQSSLLVFKYKIINKFPKIFKLYLNFRQR